MAAAAGVRFVFYGHIQFFSEDRVSEKRQHQCTVDYQNRVNEHDFILEF